MNRISNHIVFSFFSPVLAIYNATKRRSEKFVVFAGTIFMGLVGSCFVYVKGTDGHTHLMDVKEHYMEMDFLQFIHDLGNLLLFRPTQGSSDVYKHVISYLSGSVFGVPELIHLFGGLLLGYFFTKSVLLVLEDRSQQKMGVLLISMIALFLISRSISALNSLRMWTAMWVFFYGALATVKRKSYKYLWIVGLAAFIHFSYLLYALPLIAAVLLKKRKKIVLAIFIGSFFVSIGFQQAYSLVQGAGIYQDKAKYNVVDEEVLERRAGERDVSNQNFYKRIGPTIYKDFSTILLASLLSFIYLKRKRQVHLDFLIAGGLLLLAVSNLAESTSPSVYGRGYTIASVFLVAAGIIYLFRENEIIRRRFPRRVVRLGLMLFLLSAVPYVLFNISYVFNSVSFFIFLFPLGSWILGSGDISIRDLIAFDF